jgi:hypothetical protein
MLLLKIKNIVVKIWPLCALQRKINILNDELSLKNQDVIHLNFEIKLLEKSNEDLEICNKELENEIKEKNELQKKLEIKLETVINEKKELEKEINNKSIQSNFRSGEFWNNLYYNNGNSGTGSYNKLAEFKAEVVNNLLLEKNIETTIEFGCGDGNQLSLIKYNYYV